MRVNTWSSLHGRRRYSSHRRVPCQQHDQVQAELMQARADGSAKVYSISCNPLTVARSTIPREKCKPRRVWSAPSSRKP